MNRRDFLRLLGVGAAAAAAVPAALLEEPRRRIWQVPSNAPVGSRIERAGGSAGFAAWLPDDGLDDDRVDAALYAFRQTRQISAGSMHFEVGQRVRFELPGRGIVEELREAESELDRALRNMRGDLARSLFDTVTIVGVDRGAGTITLARETKR